MMTLQEVKQTIYHRRREKHYELSDNKGRYAPNIVSYRDQDGTLHWTNYPNEFALSVEERSKERAVDVLRDVAKKELEPDRNALLDAVRQKMGFGDPAADGRAGRMLDAAMQRLFWKEKQNVFCAFAGSDFVEWSDLNAVSGREKERMVLEWAGKMAESPEGAGFMLEDSDRRELLDALQRKAGASAGIAEAMLDAEAVKAAAGRPAASLSSAELRGAVESSLASETKEAVLERQKAAREAAGKMRDLVRGRMKHSENMTARWLHQKAAKNSDRYVARFVEDGDAGGLERARAEAKQSMANAAEEAGKWRRHCQTTLEMMEAELQKQLAAIEQTTSERLQNASRKESMPSAAAERKANAGALANCFPGGMGRTAQEAMLAREQNGTAAQEMKSPS